MGKLIRMDKTGHTRIAEWTAEDADAAVAGLPRAARRGLLRRRHARRGARRAGARAAAGRRHGDPAPADRGWLSSQVLTETAGVYWRPRVDARRLQVDRPAVDASSTFAHTVPWLLMAGFLLYLEPLSFPLAIILVAHAWIIPELYAKRGANVLRPAKRLSATRRSGRRSACSATSSATRRASCTRDTGAGPRARPARHLARRRAGRRPVHRGRPARALLLRPRRGPGPAERRPHRPPAARPARGRGGLRDGRQPGLLRRAVAPAAPPRAPARPRSMPRGCRVHRISRQISPNVHNCRQGSRWTMHA